MEREEGRNTENKSVKHRVEGKERREIGTARERERERERGIERVGTLPAGRMPTVLELRVIARTPCQRGVSPDSPQHTHTHTRIIPQIVNYFSRSMMHPSAKKQI